MLNERRARRLVIYPKDVELIIGKGEYAARRLLAEIRKKLGKSKQSLVSVSEFCAHTQLAEHEVQQNLR